MDSKRLADAIFTFVDTARAELLAQLAALEQRVLELEARDAARTPGDGVRGTRMPADTKEG